MGISALKWYGVKLVPIEEMTQALTVNVATATLKPKQWVRIKRGIYQGDLAQVGCWILSLKVENVLMAI